MKLPLQEMYLNLLKSDENANSDFSPELHYKSYGNKSSKEGITL